MTTTTSIEARIEVADGRATLVLNDGAPEGADRLPLRPGWIVSYDGRSQFASAAAFERVESDRPGTFALRSVGVTFYYDLATISIREIVDVDGRFVVRDVAVPADVPSTS